MALAISSGTGRSNLAVKWRLSFAIRDGSDPSTFLLVRSSAAFSGGELEEFHDSDLWELPCFEVESSLRDAKQLIHSEFTEQLEAALRKAGVGNLDFQPAIEKIQELVLLPVHFVSFWGLVTEPDFGPKHLLRTVVVVVETGRSTSTTGRAEWFNSSRALQLLVNETPSVERIGLLAANLFYPSFPKGICCDIKLENAYQEYPPKILVMPMASRTLKPFCKTNLVVCAPTYSETLLGNDNEVLTADALVVDPGCSVPSQGQLAAIVTLLPKKLLVFVTHHHLDHTEGLPAISQSNGDAVVIAHQKTLQRMSSVLSGLKCIPVVGGTKLHVRGQRFEIISAPGHTDGHLCLFHCDTRTLVAGDHCVGEGSSILDGNSGGNLHDYLETSHRLLQLAPKVVVPMHGRPNLWPAQLLKGYIRHRQTREATILRAIEAGATSAFDIVSDAYKQTHLSLWPAALLNVNSHIEHLERQKKLPPGFSVEAFKRSCGRNFMLRWFGKLVASKVFTNCFLSGIVLVGGVFYGFRQWKLRYVTE